MNMKFAVGGASAIAMAVLLIGKRFNHLVENTGQAAGVKCAVPVRTVEPNARAEQELETFVHQRDRLVVVVFYAAWCFPSVDTKPVVESVAREFGDAVTVKCIDVDRAGSLLAAYGVEHVPDVRFFRHGSQIDAFAGAKTKEELRVKFEGLTGSAAVPKPESSPVSALRSLLSKPAQPEPEPQAPSGPGTFEPMKKGWMPTGMERR